MSDLKERTYDSSGNVKSPASSIFVEKEDEMFRCYKLFWFIGSAIYKEKEYVKGSFKLAVQKAKQIIEWHHERREEKREEDQKNHQRLYLSWKKYKKSMMDRNPRGKEYWFTRSGEDAYTWDTLFGKQKKS